MLYQLSYLSKSFGINDLRNGSAAHPNDCGCGGRERQPLAAGHFSRSLGACTRPAPVSRQVQPSALGHFFAATARPVTCLAASTYGCYSVRKFASLTRVMSNCRPAFSPQPLDRQRLGKRIAMSATSPSTSLPVDHHLRRRPLRAIPRKASSSRHFRRLAQSAARRNPKLPSGQVPMRARATVQRRIPPDLG